MTDLTAPSRTRAVPSTGRAEIAISLTLLSTLVIYGAVILSFPQATLEEAMILFSGYIASAFAFTCIVLVATVLVVWVQAFGKQKPIAHFVAAFVYRWQYDRLVSFLTPGLVFALTLASFNTFKQRVLPSAGFPFDPLFRDLERQLFLGVDPWQITHRLFPTAEATKFIDSLYHSWFVLAVAIIFLAGFTRGLHLRATMLMTYVMVWVVIGSVSAYALGSAGPCFYNALVGPDASFAALNARLAEQSAETSGLVSLSTQNMLLTALGSERIFYGGGISAMPSVHVSLTVLFAIVALRLNLIVGALAVIYTVMIWIGSVHLGWHYALDGVVGAALTIGLWQLAWKINGAVIARMDRIGNVSG